MLCTASDCTRSSSTYVKGPLCMQQIIREILFYQVQVWGWDRMAFVGKFSFSPQKPKKRRSLLYYLCCILCETIQGAYTTLWVIQVESIGNWTWVTGKTQPKIPNRCRECLTPHSTLRIYFSSKHHRFNI